jgi:clan AA aspartic protease
MKGVVDDYGRALIPIRLEHPVNGTVVKGDAWVDTGCTGDLVLPHSQISSLGLQHSATVKVGLADGSEVLLDTFSCLVEWFGELKQVEAIANQGQFPLVGVGLLKDHKLTINYPKRTMTIN